MYEKLNSEQISELKNKILQFRKLQDDEEIQKFINGYNISWEEAEQAVKDGKLTSVMLRKLIKDGDIDLEETDWILDLILEKKLPESILYFLVKKDKLKEKTIKRVVNLVIEKKIEEEILYFIMNDNYDPSISQQYVVDEEDVVIDAILEGNLEEALLVNYTKSALKPENETKIVDIIYDEDAKRHNLILIMLDDLYDFQDKSLKRMLEKITNNSDDNLEYNFEELFCHILLYSDLTPEMIDMVVESGIEGFIKLIIKEYYPCLEFSY